MNLIELDQVNLEYRNRKGEILEDGIIDPNYFANSSIKLLWILKEANGPDDAGWNIKKVFYGNLKSYSRWKATFKKLVQVSYAICNSCFNFDKLPNDEILADITKFISIINVKKIGGDSTANLGKIEKYYNETKDLFYRQVIAIDADIIIICCNIWDIFNRLGEGKCIRTDYLHYCINNNKLIIYTKHPGCRSSQKEYYENICKCVELYINTK
jgi:hypothetical protein